MTHQAIQQLARQLLNQHGLTEWKLGWNRRKRAAGVCNYRRKAIELSVYWIRQASDDDIRNTLLHEIAHALTPGQKHNHVWRAKCRQIGAKPERCTTVQSNAPAKWVGVCNCDIKHNFYRKPKRSYRCTSCKGDITVKGTT